MVITSSRLSAQPLPAKRRAARQGLVAPLPALVTTSTDDKRMAGFEQVARHRRAHVAETDEGDFHDLSIVTT